MIIVAPQLNDWKETSARQTIALTRYFLGHYNIDPQKVYLNGYSGGGETGSLVMEICKIRRKYYEKANGGQGSSR